MKIEVYKPEQIDAVVELIEYVQDCLVAQEEHLSDEIYDMLQEAIDILAQEKEE